MVTSEEPVAPADPPPDTSRIASLLRQIRARLTGLSAAVAGLLVLATVPLLISFSTTQIKELFDQFTGGCLLVLDKQSAPNGQLYVTGRIAGMMPTRLPLVFEAREAQLNTIEFVDAYRFERIPEPDDLAFHPLTYQVCPGSLCGDAGNELQSGRVQIMLTDLRPEFTLRFSVRMVPARVGAVAAPNNLKVYAAFDSGFEGAVCRVQPRKWFNFWVWATPLKKALLFVVIILSGGLLVKWAQRAKENKS